MVASVNLKTSLEKIKSKRTAWQNTEDNSLINKRNSSDTINNFKQNLLVPNAIFKIQDIKTLCVNYRLRFLDYAYFKGTIPTEAIEKVKQLEKQHQTTLLHLKIVAPSKSFRLKNADDPLLFAPMGNDNYYLVHQWGNDLHPLRKVLMWPYKCLENLVFTIFMASVFLTLLVPEGLFSKEFSINQQFIVFLFMFKWVGAIVLFYGVALGKNFNNQMWNSNYFNA